MQRLVSVLLAFCIFLLPGALLAQRTGTLQGRVYDAVTQEPLAGAVLKVDSTSLGTLADSLGRFTLRDIPRGIRTLRATYTGYREAVKFEVRIESGVTELDFALEPAEAQLGEVVITSSAFAKTSQNIISLKSIGAEQIRSNPGGNFDISKVVQSLPGVTGSVGFRNDLIVRGGAPNENVFYLDGIEIPNINHFATQGSGGGPVGILNSAFIQNVTFQSSAFGAQYDNALSSVLDFEMISGNRERFQVQTIISATEAGVTFDTPMDRQGKVTALFSVRRSYLQLLFKQIGLPFLPDYWDFQGKINWQISPRTTLSYVGVGAIDRLSLNTSGDLKPEQRDVLDRIPVNNQDSYTHGVVLKHLTNRGFFTIALSRNELRNRAFKYDDNNTAGTLVQDYNSVEAENKLRLNVVSRLGDWRLNYGAVLQYVTFQSSTYNLRGPGDTVRASGNIGFWRYGVHGSLSRTFLANRLTANFGVRADFNTFTDKGQQPLEALSPRLSLSYALSPDWSLNASIGRYYKLPAYTLLGFTQQGVNANASSRYIQSDHYVLGLEYRPNSSSIIAIEGFWKQYDRYPVSLKDGISLANTGGGFGVYGNEAVASTGRGRSYGVEMYAQKRLTKSLYGIASYTLYWSQFSGTNGEYIRSAWDYRNLVSLTGGWLFGKDQRWELSGKWRLLGGAPFTPWRLDQDAANFYAVRGQGLPDYTRLNTEQTTSFSQVDVRFERRWFFSKWSLTVFIDIQNVLNTRNAAPPNFALQRTPDGTDYATDGSGNYIPILVKNDQTALLPSFGIRARF